MSVYLNSSDRAVGVRLSAVYEIPLFVTHWVCYAKETWAQAVRAVLPQSPSDEMCAPGRRRRRQLTNFPPRVTVDPSYSHITSLTELWITSLTVMESFQVLFSCRLFCVSLLRVPLTPIIVSAASLYKPPLTSSTLLTWSSTRRNL